MHYACILCFIITLYLPSANVINALYYIGNVTNTLYYKGHVTYALYYIKNVTNAFYYNKLSFYYINIRKQQL